MTSRMLSGIVALAYLITAFTLGGGELALRLFIFLLLPLACIWFSDAMGGYTGFIGLGKPAVTRETPGCIIAAGGWLLLVIPLFVGLWFFLNGAGG